MIDFPLPNGHYYGPRSFDLKAHDGSASVDDAVNIGTWQRQYSLIVDRDQPITCRFDGPTQRAVVAVQISAGLDVTATLDAPTWKAVFSSDTSGGVLTAPGATLADEQEPEVVKPTPEPLEASEAVEAVEDAGEATPVASQAPANTPKDLARRGPGRPRVRL